MTCKKDSIFTSVLCFPKHSLQLCMARSVLILVVKYVNLYSAVFVISNLNTSLTLLVPECNSLILAL